VTAITGKSGIEGMMIHMDNCKVHNSAKTTQRLEESQVIRFAHPAYSADISPCAFWFFGWSKDMMKGYQFQSADDVQAFLVDLSSHLDQSTLLSVYEGWITRLEEVIATNGESCSKEAIEILLYSAGRAGGRIKTFRHPSLRWTAGHLMINIFVPDRGGAITVFVFRSSQSAEPSSSRLKTSSAHFPASPRRQFATPPHTGDIE
jgi:hypothetical protein